MRVNKMSRDGFSMLTVTEQNAICTKAAEVIRVMEEGLKMFHISEENQNRIDQVSAEQLRMLVLHGRHVAENAITKAESIAEGMANE